MELTDAQLAQNIKDKDIKTYEYIVDKYSKQMYYLAYAILHISCSKEDIEECVADAFLEAWTNINKFNPEKAGFKTWLFILVKYKALKRKRKSLKYQTMNLDDLRLESPENIEMQFISRQAQEKIIAIISTFNDIDKELFLRRYFYGEKIQDLMDSMNLTRPAIDLRVETSSSGRIVKIRMAMLKLLN